MESARPRTGHTIVEYASSQIWSKRSTYVVDIDLPAGMRVVTNADSDDHDDRTSSDARLHAQPRGERAPDGGAAAAVRRVPRAAVRRAPRRVRPARGRRRPVSVSGTVSSGTHRSSVN